jgi:hypothetical protein
VLRRLFLVGMTCKVILVTMMFSLLIEGEPVDVGVCSLLAYISGGPLCKAESKALSQAAS